VKYRLWNVGRNEPGTCHTTAPAGRLSASSTDVDVHPTCWKPGLGKGAHHFGSAAATNGRGLTGPESPSRTCPPAGTISSMITDSRASRELTSIVKTRECTSGSPHAVPPFARADLVQNHALYRLEVGRGGRCAFMFDLHTLSAGIIRFLGCRMRAPCAYDSKRTTGALRSYCQ